MRILCLFFPRLATDLAMSHPGQPLILIDGHGDEAVVTASNVAKVGRGMSAGQARLRAPHAAYLPDNAGDCLDDLQRLAAIVRKNATPSVAIGGRDHLFVDLEGVRGDDLAIASRLLRTVSEWSGSEVRAGVASSRAAAIEAARAARHAPIVDTASPSTDEAPVTWRDDTEGLSVTIPADSHLTANLAKAAARLTALLDGRGEGFREIAITIDGRVPARARTRNPLYAVADAFHLLPDLASIAPPDSNAVTLSVANLSPDVRVRPASQPAIRRERAPRVPVRRLRQLILPLAS